MLFFGSCENRQAKTTNNALFDVSIDSSVQPKNEQTDTLLSKLSNPVQLDTFLENITCQQRVKVLTELTEKQNGNIYTYSGGGYTFKLKLKLDKSFDIFPADENAENTVFYDGKTKIVFRDYKVTCYNNRNYDCDDFGFNSFNYFNNPKIIEVCGKKFLYSDVGFPCNGMGCGNKLTMIYDLKEKKPTFVGNFRLNFDGFLLSDFNNDSIPDLLVIAKTRKRDIKGIDAYEFNMKLLVYTYDKGVFKLNRKNYYDLYGVSLSDSGFDENLSIVKDSWFDLK